MILPKPIDHFIRKVCAFHDMIRVTMFCFSANTIGLCKSCSNVGRQCGYFQNIAINGICKVCCEHVMWIFPVSLGCVEMYYHERYVVMPLGVCNRRITEEKIMVGTSKTCGGWPAVGTIKKNKMLSMKKICSGWMILHHIGVYHHMDMQFPVWSTCGYTPWSSSCSFIILRLSVPIHLLT